MAADDDHNERTPGTEPDGSQRPQQRQQPQRAQSRKQLLVGYAVAGAITLAIVAGLVVVISSGGEDESAEVEASAGAKDRLDRSYGILPDGVVVDDRAAGEAPSGGDVPDLQAAAAAADCELLLDQEDEGNAHLAANDEVPDYAANPPTSGDHSPSPLADGAFASTPSPLNYVHSLEHGRIAIEYHSDLPEDQQQALLGLYDQDDKGMILFPNDDQPYPIAVTAWRQTMACDDYQEAATLDAIRAFKLAYRARGPEPIAMG